MFPDKVEHPLAAELLGVFVLDGQDDFLKLADVRLHNGYTIVGNHLFDQAVFHIVGIFQTGLGSIDRRGDDQLIEIGGQLILTASDTHISRMAY